MVLDCLLLTAVVSYLYGSVRVGQRELRISKAARIQLAILAASTCCCRVRACGSTAFRTLVEPSERITGPGIRRHQRRDPRPDDPRDRGPVIVALAFFVTASIGRWRYR